VVVQQQPTGVPRPIWCGDSEAPAVTGHPDASDPAMMPDWMRRARDDAFRRLACLGCGKSISTAGSGTPRGFVQKGGIVACDECIERLASAQRHLPRPETSPPDS
jgi:hypothetical protein